MARWFLKVGDASGTVAKTTSAYDKEVSDILGVNLIYATHHALGSAKKFLSVFEELQLQRLEIDCFDFSGPAF